MYWPWFVTFSFFQFLWHQISSWLLSVMDIRSNCIFCMMGCREAKSQNIVRYCIFLRPPTHSQSFTFECNSWRDRWWSPSVVCLLNIRPLSSARWPTLSIYSEEQSIICIPLGSCSPLTHHVLYTKSLDAAHSLANA